MSLAEQTPEEAAVQALTEAGYDEIEITGCKRIRVPGRPTARAWVASATAHHQDGKRYEVDLPVGEVFGGLKGLISQIRTREID
jgi:hypothetical protein